MAEKKKDDPILAKVAEQGILGKKIVPSMADRVSAINSAKESVGPLASPDLLEAMESAIMNTNWENGKNPMPNVAEGKPAVKAGNVTMVTSKKPALPDPIVEAYSNEGILGAKPGMVKADGQDNAEKKSAPLSPSSQNAPAAQRKVPSSEIRDPFLQKLEEEGIFGKDISKVDLSKPFIADPEAAVEIAITYGRGIEKLKSLIADGLDVNQRDEKGMTLLMRAAFNNLIDVAGLLLDTGASINAKGIDDWTALIYAANKGHYETVELLLKHGADVNAVGTDSETALSRAKKWDHTKIVQLLANHKITHVVELPEKHEIKK